MSWNIDHLAPVETMLFQGGLIKVGSFVCAADHPCFPVSESLDNDVFVLPKMPLWLRRDDDEYRFVEPGSIVMHRAGQTLERRRSANHGERTYWFGIHPEQFRAALCHYNLPAHDMGGALIVEPKFRYRLAVLVQQLEAGGVDPLAVEEEVLGLFFEICRIRAERLQSLREARTETVLRQRRLVDKARAVLDANLSDNVSLESVADAVGTSLYHLCRVFRGRTGLTMHAYRTRQRLWYVLDQLVTGDASNLSKLAVDQGFSSHSHLNRIFQKQMGLPPSLVRRQARSSCTS
jgi:AraC-like DNA-binding protein